MLQHTSSSVQLLFGFLGGFGLVSCFINKRQDSVDVSWTREFRIKNSCVNRGRRGGVTHY